MSPHICHPLLTKHDNYAKIKDRAYKLVNQGKGAQALSYIQNTVINLNTYRANHLANRCTVRATQLAKEFQLSHGGSLSIFRVSATNFDLFNRPTNLTVGLKTLGDFESTPSKEHLRQTASKTTYQSFDPTANTYCVGILKNHTIYLSVYKNLGDHHENVLAFLHSMNQFLINNDYLAA